MAVAGRRIPNTGGGPRIPVAGLWRGVAASSAALVLLFTVASPAQGQILNRLRKKAEEALDRTAVLERLLEEPPGITTSIHDARFEVPFLDGHDPGGHANMGALPRTDENAFFAPPGLYSMEARSYCIHAGTYGPTGGKGYALAPLEGELAPVLKTLVRRSVDHPEIAQDDLQSLIWALQSRISVNELAPELRAVAETLLDPQQLDDLSEHALDRVKEELLEEARDRMPAPVRRVARAEAELRALLRGGAAFEKLEEVAVLVGTPPPEETVREVPGARWNYHPDGYFVRYQPRGYAETRVESYVPETYRVSRDGEGRIAEVAGPRGTELGFVYGEDAPESGGGPAPLREVRLDRVRGQEEEPLATWKGEAWTFVGSSLPERWPGGRMAEAGMEGRLDRAREVKDQVRALVEAAGRPAAGTPRADLTDLGHLRMALLDTGDEVSEGILTVLTHAWAYSLCVEAGGCAPPRIALAPAPAAFPAVEPTGVHGPAVIPTDVLHVRPPTSPLLWAGGGASMDPGGNVAAPGNTGAQRLLQSPKPTEDPADRAMKALAVFLALADVVASSGLGEAAYNALGLGGLPVGHLGLPMMMAGGMISRVTDTWTTATDALAGDTGGGSGGDEGGGGSGDSPGGWGWSGGGVEDPPTDPSDTGGEVSPESENRSEARSDGADFENTPPPNPPPNPTPPPPGGGGGSPGSSAAATEFTEALLVTLHHTQGLTDSRLRHEAACEAGESEWAERQAGLAGRHLREAALGMIEAADRLDALADMAREEGTFGYSGASAEEMAEVQERLESQGWTEEELRVAGVLGITDEELEGLRMHLVARDPEKLAGNLGEAVELWSRELRTTGLLWLALPAPTGGCG